MAVSPNAILDEIFSVVPEIKARLPGGRSDQGSAGVTTLQWSGTGKFFTSKEAATDGRFRGLTLNDIKTVFETRFGSRPTDAEASLLMRLVAGESLPDIAAADGISYGTRRNQLSALREKAGISRQAELVSVVSVLCANLLTSVVGESSGSAKDILELYAAYYGGNLRIHRPILSTGREILVVDCGPLDGRIAICMGLVAQIGG